MWREVPPYTSLCRSASTLRYTLPMLSTHLGKFCFLSPALNCGRTGEKSTKATERALPLCLFHPFSEKQWQDLMEYIIPFRFCMLCLKALIKKKRQPTMHTLDGTHKNTCEFKATELRKVVPTFPPTLYIICIQGFWNDIVIWWCTSLLYCLAGQISLRFLCRTNTIFPCQRCIISWRS